MTDMSKTKMQMVCATCGSDDVHCDAYAQWSVATQEWELSETFDKGSFCGTCDGECRIEARAAFPEEIAAAADDNPDYDDDGNLKAGVDHT